MSLGSLRFAALPSYRPRRSEQDGHGRERPPDLGCLDRHSKGRACAWPMPPSRRVAPVLESIPAGKAMEPMRDANRVSVERLVPVT